MTVRWLALLLLAALPTHAAELRGTGDLGIVVEREAGAVAVVESSNATILGRVEGLGDLSHASAVFGRDGRHAYVFGRDGGLSKVDLLARSLVGRVVQAGNSIGGAISDDGHLIAVSNYEPGGVKVFDAVTLEQAIELVNAKGGSTKKKAPAKKATAKKPAAKKAAPKKKAAKKDEE